MERGITFSFDFQLLLLGLVGNTHFSLMDTLLLTSKFFLLFYFPEDINTASLGF